MKHTKIICFSTPRFRESLYEILAAMVEKREVDVKVVDYNWLKIRTEVKNE